MPLSTLKGPLSAADIVLLTDALAAYVKTTAPALGLNLPNESGTIASKAHAVRLVTLGDGTTTYPGLGSPDFQGRVTAGLDALVGALSWDKRIARDARQIVTELNNMVKQGLPSGWIMNDGTNPQAFDNWLMRLNGTAAPFNGTPAAGSTAALTDATGALVATNSNAPWISHSFVGDKDWKESLPSTPVQGVALASPNNGYTYTISGSVPASTSKVRLYRTYYGGLTGGVKYWDQDISVTAGGAYPTMKIVKPDGLLNAAINPASWLQCQVLPEFAALFALAYSSIPLVTDQPLQLVSSGMLSPQNVVLIPSTGTLGLGNPAQSGQFGRCSVTGAATMTWNAGSFQTGNNAAANVQGFAGSQATATGTLEALLTQPITSAGTVTISYTYVDATTGYSGIPTTVVGATATFAGTAAGQKAVFTIAAGRLVKSVTVTAVSGMGAGIGGEFVIHSQAPRTY